jgi:hypothetical protein
VRWSGQRCFCWRRCRFRRTSRYRRIRGTGQKKTQRSRKPATALIRRNYVEPAVGIDVGERHSARHGADLTQGTAQIAVARPHLDHAVAEAEKERDGIIVLDRNREIRIEVLVEIAGCDR